MIKTFKVKGINCKGCEKQIRDKLSIQKGITEVNASSVTGNIKIVFNENTITESNIIDLLAKQGYKVSCVE